MSLSATILDCAGPELSKSEAGFFRDTRPWGFTLFARNIVDPVQVERLCGALREAAGHEAPVFVDQEGGRVQRLGPPHWHSYLPALEQAARAGHRGPESFRLRGLMLAAELRTVGIDGNYAPCADIAWPQTHPFLRDRCAGESAAQVATNTRALADGLLAGGVLPVIKHLPGHGRAHTDSHLETPVISASQADLETTDFAAFRALGDLPLAMTAHIRLAWLGPEPATLNPRAIELIRVSLGFEGLLMSDDISMQALSGTFAERAAKARDAGCDVVLCCNLALVEQSAVVEAAGALEGRAAERAQRALFARRAPLAALDFVTLKSDLEELLDAAQPSLG